MAKDCVESNERRKVKESEAWASKEESKRPWWRSVGSNQKWKVAHITSPVRPSATVTLSRDLGHCLARRSLHCIESHKLWE